MSTSSSEEEESFSERIGWIKMFERCKKDLKSAAGLVKKRQKQLEKSSTGSDRGVDKRMRLKGILRRKMNDISLMVSDLRDGIPHLDVTENEKNSRIDEVKQLEKEYRKIDNDFKNVGAAMRKGLFGKEDQKKKRWKVGEEPEHVRAMENEQIITYQNKVITKQNKNVKKIGKRLDRTKQVVETIGDEIDESTMLLEDLHDEVEVAEHGIERQNRRIDLLKKASPIGLGLICCAIVLFTILAIMIGLILYFAISSATKKKKD